MDIEETDVLVVGSGPVGMMAALLLGRAGVRTLVVERHAGLAQHPKAIGVHPRSMELFRQLGLADEVRSVALPPERTLAFAWLTRMTGIELGAIFLAEDAERLAEYAAQSPEFPAFAPQDRIEPVLAAALAACPQVEVRMSTTVEELELELEQDADGVRARLVAADGTTRTVQARYAVAADGAHSRTRQRLGFGETAGEPYGESVNVYFSADLEAVRAGRPYLLWWVINPDVQGTFWPTAPNRWIFNFEGDTSKPDAYFTEDMCRELVRQGAGVPDLEVDIHSVLRWRHEQAVADRWRQGRVLLVGDAAHRFPPHGGFGMNSGLQDAANLAWKLAAVLQGRAGDRLLDSYQTERKPVAEENADQVALNTKRMEETGWLMADPSLLSTIERPEGEAVRRAIGEAIPRQREQFWSEGQQFGQIYADGALVDDGTEAVRSTVADYRPTTHPGARFPHLWVTGPDGRRMSTLDVLGRGFVLFHRPGGEDGADRVGWAAAAQRAGDALGVDVAAYGIGDGSDLRPEVPAAAAVLELAPGSAVLVRPDGVVAFRLLAAPPDAGAALTDALRSILARP